MSLPLVKNLRSVPGFAWKFLMNVQVPVPLVMAADGGVPVVGESGVRGLVWSARATVARGNTIRTRTKLSRAGDLRIGVSTSLFVGSRSGGQRPSRSRSGPVVL